MSHRNKKNSTAMASLPGETSNLQAEKDTEERDE